MIGNQCCLALDDSWGVPFPHALLWGKDKWGAWTLPNRSLSLLNCGNNLDWRGVPRCHQMAWVMVFATEESSVCALHMLAHVWGQRTTRVWFLRVTPHFAFVSFWFYMCMYMWCAHECVLMYLSAHVRTGTCDSRYWHWASSSIISIILHCIFWGLLSHGIQSSLTNLSLGSLPLPAELWGYSWAATPTLYVNAGYLNPGPCGTEPSLQPISFLGTALAGKYDCTVSAPVSTFPNPLRRLIRCVPSPPINERALLLGCSSLGTLLRVVF